MSKCPCQMTSFELLQANLAHSRPVKSILIIDNGDGWNVTMYGPDSAGLGTDHITVQATLEKTEALLANLRRQPDVDTVGGVVITDPEAIVRELSGAR